MKTLTVALCAGNRQLNYPTKFNNIDSYSCDVQGLTIIIQMLAFIAKIYNSKCPADNSLAILMFDERKVLGNSRSLRTNSTARVH